jgi:hypothetical protein
MARGKNNNTPFRLRLELRIPSHSSSKHSSVQELAIVDQYSSPPQLPIRLHSALDMRCHAYDILRSPAHRLPHSPARVQHLQSTDRRSALGSHVVWRKRGPGRRAGKEDRKQASKQADSQTSKGTTTTISAQAHR